MILSDEFTENDKVIYFRFDNYAKDKTFMISNILKVSNDDITFCPDKIRYVLNARRFINNLFETALVSKFAKIK